MTINQRQYRRYQLAHSIIKRYREKRVQLEYMLNRNEITDRKFAALRGLYLSFIKAAKRSLDNLYGHE